MAFLSIEAHWILWCQWFVLKFFNSDLSLAYNIHRSWMFLRRNFALIWKYYWKMKKKKGEVISIKYFCIFHLRQWWCSLLWRCIATERENRSVWCDGSKVFVTFVLMVNCPLVILPCFHVIGYGSLKTQNPRNNTLPECFHWLSVGQ